MLHIILYVIGFNSVSDQSEMKYALFTSLPDKKVREVSRVFRSSVYWVSRIE